jgi:threonine/homoserine/homoserine lactone efflux protein
MSLLLKGIVIGFAVAAPVGPIGLLCIRRTLWGGRLAGFTAGLGAALADTVFGFIAAFGLTLVWDFLTANTRWFALGAAVVLIYIGVTEWRSRPSDPVLAAPPTAAGLLGGLVSTFFLTLANPLTILSFAAIFTGLGIEGHRVSADGTNPDYAVMAELIGGVFIGSAGWWLLLAGGVDVIRHRLNGTTLKWLNRVSGTGLLGFGLFMLYRFFFGFFFG